MQLLRLLKEQAKEQELTLLHRDASLHAVPFHTEAGFESQREAKYRLTPGVEIAYVVTAKILTVKKKTSSNKRPAADAAPVAVFSGAESVHLGPCR
jgi:hypothetical protein